MLYINNFSKSYDGKNKAVDNLNLHVNKGEIFGFIGHNGAGKSTTIKSITGIIDFEEGDIIISGKSIKHNPYECKKRMAYIPDNPNLYEYLTAMDYLHFVGNVYGMDFIDCSNQIKKYAEVFEIEKKLNSTISSFSHGMKQKVAIIAALIHRPELLVMDEPFVGLDPRAAFSLKTIMKEMCKEGSTIFFSSHVLEVVEKICTRVGMINKGRLVKCGRVDELTKELSLENIFMEELNRDEK